MRSLKQEYEILAPRYDQRWEFYVEQSLRETLTRLKLSDGEQVLDVGCGTGELLHRAQAWAPSLRLSGTDPSAAMLKQARAKVGGAASLMQARAEHLPFANTAFDVAVCSSVLHYLPEPAQALAEIRRVLKPGGRLALTDWCHDYLACRLLGHFLRLSRRPLAHIYTTAECGDLLEKAGFQSPDIDRYKISAMWGLMTAIACR